MSELNLQFLIKNNCNVPTAAMKNSLHKSPQILNLHRRRGTIVSAWRGKRNALVRSSLSQIHDERFPHLLPSLVFRNFMHSSPMNRTSGVRGSLSNPE